MRYRKIVPWYDLDELRKELEREHRRAMLEWLYEHYPELITDE